MRFRILAAPAVAVCAAIAPATAQDASLYRRLGGYKAIVAVVDDFVGNVAADRRINRVFASANIPRLKQNLVDQICAAAGGETAFIPAAT
jgi:hemoglobin